MTLDDLIKIDFTGKEVVIIGRPGSGKTWLSNVLGGMFKYHTVIHTDSYLTYEGVGRQVYAAFEDANHYKHTIVEGILGYELLLEGFKRKSYLPDVVIECVVSAGKQRQLYLNERDPKKIQFLRHFERVNQSKLNEYHSLVQEEEKPMFYQLNNDF